ncbi:non-ribosomal peptide synthetase [Flavobacterium hercynium]|uniref:Carrier domain-containing protein n=1 Tax=Flavobacterium hercynium TaxID=387094 RepID=A0A226H974_9FLAO|nr:non-ribosomal peptide synthetase [Flavobacterium hercynium]OXA89990.1 hypothetical protein B0A66_13365 [Flavobacterium hercynium]SMP14138.1 amino acid adenylation domain-containing protein [Flavobacterium hercynium]
MSIEILLKELVDNNVKLSVREDKLFCQLPDAGIDDKLLGSLKEHKEALKKMLLEKTSFKKNQSIPKTAEQKSYSLTASQKRLWVLSQFEGGSQAYNMSFVTKITGDLNFYFFEKAFRELIAHHEILRTVFKSDEETLEVRQNIVPANEIYFSVETLDYSTIADSPQKIEEYLDAKNKEAFDLENGPLLSVTLIKITENEFVFLLSMHHIISDGWSMEVIVAEVVQRYNTLLAGKVHGVPVLGLQYKDYAVWVEAEKQSPKYKEAEQYWVNKFAGDLTSLTLPVSRQRPAIQTFNGNTISHLFSETLTAKIKLFSEDNGVTLFTTLMTIVNALLYRYSGQDDIIVGTPVAGREHPDLERQIGLYVNTLAIRTQFNEKNTFAELLQIEKNNLIAANEHQMYSLDELVQKLSLKRDQRRSVLFDIMVVYQNQSSLNLGSKKEDADNLSFEKYNLRKNTSQFDISFNFSESNNQLELNAEYNTDIYDAALIERMFDHFHLFATKALAYPNLFIEEIDYLTAAEKQQLLFEFNDTTVDYPKDKTIVDLFEEQAARTPHNVAVSFGDITLTYKELNEQANQLAHYLRANYAIQPDDLVGIKLERSEKMIIAIFGILKSGGAYVPIDPDYPQDRIEYIEKDSNSKLVIDDNVLALFYANHEQYAASNIEKINSPDDLIYVIYTSGTTGNPKGTLLEHKNVVRLFFTDKPLFDFNEKDVWTMFHSYSFDFSVWEINGALLFGGKLIMVPKQIAQNTPAFLDLVEQEGVTVLNQTPSAFYNVINSEKSGEKKCNTLRYVIFGGEALNPTLLSDWHRKYPNAKLINMYGITETTVHVTYKEITEKEIHSEQSNIGKPIPTLKCYILDANKRMVPIGVTGELYVAGLGLARGYFNLPELTAKKFISNPFTEGERLYDSGDLASWLPDGNIEYFGRKDHQVKIRGYRIELGDIENAILQYSAVLKQVVVDVKVNNQEKILVAYLVSDAVIDRSELRTFLQAKLPDYMIPGFYITLEVLPLTHNGKINRKALPNISEQDIVKKEYEAPRNATEEILTTIWQEMMGIEKIGIADNFFDLGGHSLIVAQVINRIHKELGQTVSFTAFFEKPTIGDLSAQLQKNDYLAIPKTKEANSYPLTASQNRLWILSQLEGGSLAYNIPAAVKLTGSVDVNKFNESFRLLIDRHEILRTSFKTNENGDVEQFITPSKKINFSIAEKDFSTADHQENQIAVYFQETVNTPFNLEQAPLVRASLIKIASDEYVFFLCLHHIIGDGWSIELLISEIVKSYNALSQKKTVKLPELNIQYKDYAVWLNEALQQEKYQKSEEYWLEQFAGELPVLDLPSFKTRPSVQTYNGDYSTHQFPKSLLEKLKTFSKEQDVTLFMTLMAGVNALLHRYTGSDDIITGTPIAGREHPDLENQIGLYLNTLAIRTRLKEKSSFLDLILNQKETLLNAYDHQSYPFDALVGKLNLKRDASRSALFDVLVVLQNQAQLNNLKTEELVNLTISDYSFPRKTAQFDISFTFAEAESLNLTIEYNTDIYDSSLIEKMFVHFENLLNQFLEEPQSLIAETVYITDSEKQQVLFDFNATSIEYPKDKTVVDLFEEQAVKTPNKVAVIFEDVTLTYAQLNEQTNQLAHYLQDNYKIKADDLVGIKLDRSERMIVAIFGILKAGGAYVPLDVTYPEERIAYIASDARLKLIIDEIEFEKFSVVNDSLPKTAPKVSGLIDHLAYCIYTSGSTGKPKGVLNHHAGLYNRLLWMKAYLEVGENEVYLQKTPYTFDVSVWELILPFMTGSTLVIAKPEAHKDAVYLQNIINEKQVSVIHFVPSMLNAFLVEAEATKTSSLAHVICSGEELSVLTAHKCKEIIENAQLHNLYGPTEASIDVTAINLTKVNVLQEGVSIGKPVSNTSIYIVNDAFGLQPVGVPGELLISGVQVARGYLNLPELTQDRFIADPFKKGNQIYRTGDVAYWKADGSIQYLGRIDNQVKIRGNRIELGEIEKVLMEHEAINQAVVIAKKYNDEKVLVAYYLFAKDTTIDKAEIRDYLQQRLPAYMHPGFYVELETLPMTSSGKVNRNGLPDIEDNDLIRRQYAAPQNETEEKLVAIWSEVLRAQEIGTADDFFALGGHSLMVAQVINRIYKQLGQTVSFSAFFENPTIQGLSQRLQNNEYQAIPKATEDASYPLTDSQSRLWILSQLEGGSQAYNMPAAVTLSGTLDSSKFNESFQLLIDRHEILRTGFRTNENGEVRQYIAPSEEINFGITEKDFRAIGQPENAIANYLEQIINTAFNLEKAPLLNASLIQTEEDQHVFFLCVHHIIGDGWSTELLITEVVQIYNALTQGTQVNLPVLNIQYKDYAVWLKSALQQEKYQVSEHYWLEQFAGELPVLDLPSFKTRPLIQTYNGDYRTHQFSGAFLEQLKSFSKEQDVTIFMTLMTGVNALLHRYTGSDDIIVGTPIAGREHPDLENQMGLYLNTLAIRTRLQEKSNFLTLLRDQKETLLKAYDHQSYPFDALVGKLNLKRDTSRSALFDVLVVLQNQTQLNNLNTEELTSLKVSDYDFDKKTAQFDMSFTFIEKGELGLKIDYNTDIYDAYLIERIFVHFENLLSQFLEQPQSLIAEANYITALEKQEVLFDFNATAIDYPKDKTVLDLFEEQAAKTPNKVAVIFEDVTLTYAELNEQTNQLAHYLRDNYKIQADDLVGIQLDRSELMIIAIFGILKAGGAYVPIDVTYPEERIAYIASDAKLKLSINENEFVKFRAVQESFPKTAPKLSGLIDHLAYCIYTSGSTGNPKGVLNHHAGLYNRLLWMKAYLEVGEKEVYLQKTPYTFDVSVWELILPFMTGSTLVIARPEGHKDTAYLQGIISEKQVSIIHFVPSMLNAFLLEADKEKCSSLEHIICSGEELSVLTAAESKERFKNAQLHNLYGPTEASIDVTAINLSNVDVLQEGVSIGKPVSNTSIYIVNDAFGLQPVGVPGELLISGIQVASGYLNLPELTKDRFIADPFKTGNAIYRTGDVAYWKPDGSIQYLGRMDNQVKIRGNRIELGEIEKVLMQYDGVNQAVVIAKNYKNEKVLVAYYLLENETEIDKAAIRIYLQEKLPSYMHPGFYVELENLPMTSSGKVNRNGLPDIVDNDLIRRQYVAPRNETEEKLAAIWSEVLDVEKIGVEDDFFELGGHSLKLIKLYELIKKDVSQDVNVTHLFSMTTIHLQAQFINKHLSSSTKEENVNIVEIDF